MGANATNAGPNVTNVEANATNVEPNTTIVEANATNVEPNTTIVEANATNVGAKKRKNSRKRIDSQKKMIIFAK